MDDLKKLAKEYGIDVPDDPPSVPMAVKPSSGADVTPLLERMKGSVIARESGGQQRARNPRTDASGLYQVMPANIAPWTKKYVGRSLSQDEFLNDPKAQDAVFRGEMGRYLKKAKAKGVDDDTAIRMASAAWYGGEGAMNRYDDPKRFRPNEPSFREYTSSVLKRTPKAQSALPSADIEALAKEYGIDSLDTAPIDEPKTATSPFAVPPTPTFKSPVAPIESTPFSDTGITTASPVPTPVSDQLKDAMRGPLAPLPETPGTITTPTNGTAKLPPIPESAQTLDAQRQAMNDPRSTRAAVLYTKGEKIPPPDDATEFDLQLPTGETLRVNADKYSAIEKQIGKPLLEDIAKGGDYTLLLGGKAQPTDNTIGKPAVVTRDAKTGNELVASTIETPDAAQTEAALQKAQFPNRNTTTGVETPEQLTGSRMQGGKQDAPKTTVNNPPDDGTDQFKPFKMSVQFRDKPKGMLNSEYAIQQLVPKLAMRTGLDAIDIENYLRLGFKTTKGTPIEETPKDSYWTFDLSPGDVEAIQNIAVGKREALRKIVASGQDIDAATKDQLSKELGLDPREVADAFSGQYEYADVYKQGQALKQRYQEGLKREKAILQADEPSSVASMRAAAEVGWINTNDLDDLVRKEKDIYKQLLAENNTGANLDLSGIDAARLGAQGSKVGKDVKLDDLKYSGRDAVDALIKQYGSLAAYKREQDNLREKYKYRQLAAPLEFAKRFGNALPKAVGSILKAIPIAADLANYPTDKIVELITGKANFRGRPEDNPISQIGQGIDGYFKDLENRDFDKIHLLSTIPDALGQIAVQILAGVATGGATVPTAIGGAMGASAQYEEAAKFTDSREDRLLAAIVGGAAAVPDAIIFNKWFKALGTGEKTDFLNRFTRSIYARLGVKVGDETAETLTRATVKQWITNMAEGGAFEGIQEVSENKINDALAYARYDRSEARKQKLTSFNDEDWSSFIGGVIGGAGGGAVETAFENANAEQRDLLQDELKTRLEDFVKSGKITPEQKAAIDAAVFAEAQKRKINLEPIRVVDKKGAEFTVLEDQGEKLKVQDAKGNISVRNADRLTPINEKQTVQEPKSPVGETSLAKDTPVESTDAVSVEADPRIETTKNGNRVWKKNDEIQDVDVTQPKKFTTNRGNLDLDFAPRINPDLVDWDDTFGGATDDVGILQGLEEVRVVELRGLNADGKPVGTLMVSNADSTLKIEAIFKPSAPASGEQKKPAAPVTAAKPPVARVRYYDNSPDKPEFAAPLRPETLEGAKNRIKEIEEQRDIARREADTDPLTNIANRRALDRALPSAEADKNTSIISFDANNFGKINKELGEIAGDKALKDVADALSTAATESNAGVRVFRRGGDEFVMIVPKAEAETIRTRAEKLFGNKTYGSNTVSVSGTVGNTFEEANAELQKRKSDQKTDSAMAKEPKSSEQKEPWQMTQGEYRTFAGYHGLSGGQLTLKTKDESGKTHTQKLGRTRTRFWLKEKTERHRETIEKALAEGKPVPAEVLADYPDLTPKQSARQKLAEKAKGVTKGSKTKLDRAWDIYESKGLNAAIDYVGLIQEGTTPEQKKSLIDSLRSFDADKQKAATFEDKHGISPQRLADRFQTNEPKKYEAPGKFRLAYAQENGKLKDRYTADEAVIPEIDAEIQKDFLESYEGKKIAQPLDYTGELDLQPKPTPKSKVTGIKSLAPIVVKGRDRFTGTAKVMGEDGKLIATDGYRLLIIKDPSQTKRTFYNSETGLDTEGGSFPAYDLVTPKNAPESKPMPIQPLLDLANRAITVKKNLLQGTTVAIKLNFNGEYDAWVKAQHIYDGLRAMQANGGTEVRVASEGPNSALMFTDNVGNKYIVMPLPKVGPSTVEVPYKDSIAVIDPRPVEGLKKEVSIAKKRVKIAEKWVKEAKAKGSSFGAESKLNDVKQTLAKAEARLERKTKVKVSTQKTVADNSDLQQNSQSNKNGQSPEKRGEDAVKDAQSEPKRFNGNLESGEVTDKGEKVLGNYSRRKDAQAKADEAGGKVVPYLSGKYETGWYVVEADKTTPQPTEKAEVAAKPKQVEDESGNISLRMAADITDNPLFEAAARYPSEDAFVAAYKRREVGDMDSHVAPGFQDESVEWRMENGGDFSLVEVSKGQFNQPDDYFDPRVGARYYGYDDTAGQQSFRAIQKAFKDLAKNKNATITAYRAVPKDVTVDHLINGDWITFSKEYATTHGEHRFDEGEYKIISESVPAKFVWWDGNDINEWGYDHGKGFTEAELREIYQEASGNVSLQMAAGGGNTLDSMYDDNGAINYERVKDVAGRVERGEFEISRLDKEGEQGRIAGGKRALEASLLLGADESRRQTASSRGGSDVEPRGEARSRQEKLLENYAKHEGIWYDWNKFFKDRHFTRGGEAFIYHQSDTHVAKTVDYRHIDKSLTPQQFIDNRIALFNTIFPGAKYELMGFTKDPDGKFRFLVKQQFFDAHGLSKTDVDAYMKGKGFDPTGRESYANKIYQVHDIHEKNALKDDASRIYVIDAVPKPNYAVEPLEIAKPESLQMAAGKNVEVSLESLYNTDGGVNHEQVQTAVDQIVSGTLGLKRLTREGEQGRIDGGGLLVGSSLIIGGKTGSNAKSDPRAQRNLEEDLLESHAKDQNAWVDDIAAYKQGLGERVGRGTEAEAFEDPTDPNYLIKITPIPYILGADSSILRFFDDKIALHNTLPDVAPYELVGFGRDWNTTGSSTFHAVLRQPYIRGQETTKLDDAFVSQMQRNGFLLTGNGSMFTGDGVDILDITTHNVIKGEDGKYYIFDPMVSYQNESDYRPMEIAKADESLKMDATDSALERFKDMQYAHEQTLLEGAKSSVKDVDGQQVIELNEEGVELARRMQGLVDDKRVGAFYGSTYSTPKLRQMAKTLIEAADKYETVGYTADQVRSLRQMAKDFETLANDGSAAGVAYIFDFALPHETHHKMVLDALNGKSFPKETLSKLEKLDIWKANPTITTPDGVSKSFNSAYPRLSKQAKAFEMAAMLETGEAEHSDKDVFLKTFADGILEVTTDLDPVKYSRIIQYANTTTSDTRGNTAERTDAEQDERTDESVTETGEGTRDRTDDQGTASGQADVRAADKPRPEQPGQPKPATAKERKVASFSRILGQEYFYDPQSHEETEIIAAQLISDKGTEAAIHDALYGTPSAEGMRVVHWELERLTGALDNAIREGNKAEMAAFAEAAADLSAKIVQRQVAGGQETEIAKMLVPMSPEAALLTAQKMVEYSKGEGSTLTPDQTETVVRIAQELKDARADIAKQDKKVKSLEKKIDDLKEERPSTKTAKMLRQYQKRKPVLMKELQELFPDASVFNGETAALQMVADESFQMAASGLTDEQHEKLVEYAGGEILENKPYKTLLSELDQLTGDRELSKELHAEAVDSLRSERGSMSEEAKDNLKTRNEHYREADKILKPKGENQNVKPVIDKNFKKLNDQNVRELSRLAQRVWAKTGDPLLTLAVERLNTVPKSINDVIKDIQSANPGMSIEDAANVARKAKQLVTETKREMDEERDKLRGILPEHRKALNEARVAKQKATMKLNKFLANLADNSNIIKRFNNDLRAKFVSNWGTQAFNVIQSMGVTNPTEAMLDLFTAAFKAAGVNIGSTPDINVKDILLPMSYIFANNRQMAEFALSEFPDQFFQVHSGLLGDIDIDPVNLAENKTNALSRTAHKWFDWNQRVNNKLAQTTGAKLQEMHFRNAMVAGTFDQIIRRKSNGAETLESAIENGTVKKYITEEDAQFAASKALRVTFAANIDDKAGKFLKRAYDKFDSFVPLFLNPVTYARFTYTTTKVMVANPILFGALDAKALGGKGYDTRSLASGVLAWSGIAIAAALMANFGGDDDEWYTLKFGDTYFDIRRSFPLSTYFYMAHLIRSTAEGKPAPTKTDLLEGFASLETDYFTYGPGLEMYRAVRDKLAGTKEWSDVGRSGARLAGNFFAGYLRFFKPMRDTLAQFDEEENKLRFYNNSGADKFVQEISRSLPLVARAYGAEPQKDATGKESGMPFPFGRLFGINIVHPTFLKPEQSTATKWALKLFPYAGAGGEMSDEARKAYQMRRTIKNAIRSGMPMAEVQGQLQEYRKTFGERSFGRLKDELSMSDLAAKIKYDFGASQEIEVKALRKVWSYATDAEKAELRQILRNKKNRTAAFNREFGL